MRQSVVIRMRTQLGERLADLRQAAGLSRRQLAALAGLADRHVGDIECGRLSPTVKTLERLAAALGCEPADLLAVSGRPASMLDEQELQLLAVWRRLDDRRRQALLTLLSPPTAA